MHTSVLELAQRLIGCDTTNPPGGEGHCLPLVGEILERAGFTVRVDAYGPNRASLCARLAPGDDRPALCLAGHIDTVPPGGAPWSVNPFGGEVRDGRLYGRGACDMKGGLAAAVCAAAAVAPELPRGRDLVVHVYGGEETGCEGSAHLVRDAALLGRPGAAVVAEPSNNRPLVGHKGALWLKGRATGRTAHGSMPEHGDNALCKALDAAQRLRTLELGPAHAELGAPTLALTTLHAGMNVNSIPDAAEFTVDLRTVPGRDNAALLRAAQALAGPDVPLEVLMDLAPVWTAPDHPWVRRVRELLSGPLGPLPEVETVQFFTDAASLRAVLPDLPILVLGPGDPAQAHQTDESCSVAQLEQAVDLYTIIARDWYGREETSC